MPDKDQNSSSLHTVYRDATINRDSLPVEGQGSNLFSSSQAFVMNDVDSVIALLEICQQRLSENIKAMKGLYHRRQSMMANPNIRNTAILPIPNGDASLPFPELRFGGSKLDVIQYHAPQGLGIDIDQHVGTLNGAGPPVYRPMTVTEQASAALPYNVQTSMTAIGYESLPCQEVASYHNKRTTSFTPAYETSPQSNNFDYGHAPVIGISSRPYFPGNTLSLAALTDTSDNRDGHVRSSVAAPPGDEIGGPTVLSFMSGGIKHYRCECGYESARKVDVDHHLESLQHSERKYECSCGKWFTRDDSLNRHRKRCKNQWY